jgi:diguanylate cyclase (GGDEF)-like protein/PAS domain S-box-containing protein
MNQMQTHELSFGDRVLDTLQEPLMIITPEAKIELLNNSMRKLLGIDNDEPADEQAASLIPQEYLGNEFITRLKGEPDEARVFEGYTVFRNIKGNAIPVTYRATPVQDPRSNEIIILVVARDLRDTRGRRQEIMSVARLSDDNPFPVLRVSIEGILLYVNRGSWLLLEYWKVEVGEPVPEEWISTIHEVMDEKENREIELQIGIKTLLLVIVPVMEAGYVNIFGLDVTQHKRAEEKLRVNAQVFESATEGVMITDADLRIIDVNHAFCAITGYDYAEILGENASILQSIKHDENFYKKLWTSVKEKGTWQGEIWDRRKNGEVYPKKLSIAAITDEDGTIVRYIGLFSDISAMKQNQDQLFYMANYDSLTGLANRRFFRDRLELSIQLARRGGQSSALMIIDLDGFKLVNDNLGHQAGDGLLCKVAERIKDCVRDTDTVARIGGDEFVVLLPGISSPHNAALIAQKILSRVIEPATFEHQEIFISSSIGIAFFPEDASDAEGLMHNADTALYKAKESGKNDYQFFSPEMNRRTAERLMLHSKLRKAIDANEFFLEYQPQVDASTGKIVGTEALVRWKTGTGEVTYPNDFIPLAEENGLIHEIGDIVLREACRQGVRWCNDHCTPVRIAINISAHQLRRSDFVNRVEAILDEVRFSPLSLELELTESMLIDDGPETLEKLDHFRTLGFSLAIDDFGTKYSSLSYLRRLPIHRIKIDRVFVKDIIDDPGSYRIAAAIVAMGHSMNLDVVAEGVETEEQVTLLRSKGCDLFQGYFFSPPVSASNMSSFLRRNE